MTGTAIAISDADEAEALSEYLTSPRPPASRGSGDPSLRKPLFDAKSLASNLHDVAAVFVDGHVLADLIETAEGDDF